MGDIKISKEKYEGIMILAECRLGKLEPIVYELLGGANEINEKLRTEISVVLLGSNIGGYCESCIHHGADKIYKVDLPILAEINEEIYTELYYQIISKYKPEIVLIPSTIHSKSIAARLASRLNTGLTADCTSLDIDMTRRMLLQVRPAREGAIMATILCPEHRPQMATIRPKVMNCKAVDYSRQGQIISPNIKLPSNVKTKIIDCVKDIINQNYNPESEIIVSVGRGIKNKENLSIIEELANCLGAEIGATRPVIDQGWLEYRSQIGLTGKNVSSKIYFSIGISGAIQHTVGINSVDKIIAINNDKEAPIFKIATYGIVGDLFEVVPLLIKKIKEL
ncbi:electron transfer flavoprotein subunit alpha/FixB family protein [Clostridium estertheticum]|uniref:electron transfer flavoprotein subunit alpha/FixB family protein n=1 Tax=Clostridium estertheticum TaxID=238834 RepID=UPI0013EE6810|nr:electron transfer flavoprotein subunit alpha/FixB family protein [Clostridium estertheticum]MBZ9609071.1 electron transfer flavoprotein subunit alpha/FixB family protein [Clostridium estertheticum]